MRPHSLLCLLALLSAGCLGAAPLEGGSPAQADSATAAAQAAPPEAEPEPLPLAANFTLTRAAPDATRGTSARVLLSSEVRNQGNESVTIWWWPCRPALNTGIRLAPDDIRYEFQRACQPPPPGRVCMDPCAIDEFPTHAEENGERTLEPGASLRFEYEFTGAIQEHPDGAPRCVGPGELAMVSEVWWMRDERRITSEIPFTWTEEDAASVDARC